MGHMDCAFLSVRSACSLEKSLACVWLSTGHGCNVKRAIITRRAFFCSVATVAKKMDLRAAHARRFRSDNDIPGFAVAPPQSSGMDFGRDCGRRWLVIPSAAGIAPPRGVDCRYRRVRCLSCRCPRWRQLRVVPNRLCLWQRALSLPFYKFLLQPSITSLKSWVVSKGCLLVDSVWVSAFCNHAAMDPAVALLKHISTLRAWRRTAHAQSRSSVADRDRHALAVNVCAAGANA